MAVKLIIKNMGLVKDECIECRGPRKFREGLEDYARLVREGGFSISRGAWHYRQADSQVWSEEWRLENFREAQRNAQQRQDEADQIEASIDEQVARQIGNCEGPITLKIGNIGLVSICRYSLAGLALQEIGVGISSREPK